MSTIKQKLKFIEKELSEEEIDVIIDNIKKKNKKKKPLKAVKVSVVDTTSNKYKVLLKFVNKILVNIGEERITDLTDFKNIDRLDIILPKNKRILNEMSPELFKHFKKMSQFYKKTDTIVLIVLRGLCKQIGLKMAYVRKDVGEVLNNQSYRRTHLYYSIKNI